MDVFVISPYVKGAFFIPVPRSYIGICQERSLKKDHVGGSFIQGIFTLHVSSLSYAHVDRVRVCHPFLTFYSLLGGNFESLQLRGHSCTRSWLTVGFEKANGNALPKIVRASSAVESGCSEASPHEKFNLWGSFSPLCEKTQSAQSVWPSWFNGFFFGKISFQKKGRPTGILIRKASVIFILEFKSLIKLPIFSRSGGCLIWNFCVKGTSPFLVSG